MSNLIQSCTLTSHLHGFRLVRERFYATGVETSRGYELGQSTGGTAWLQRQRHLLFYRVTWIWLGT
jgi:hypothetical protein